MGEIDLARDLWRRGSESEIRDALDAAHSAGASGFAELLTLAADMAIDISVRRNVQPKSLRAFLEKYPDAFQAALDRATNDISKEKSNG